MAKAAHRTHTLAAHFACEHRTEPVPPVAHSLMTDVDAALRKQVFDVPQ